MKNLILSLFAIICFSISAFSQAERITTINGKKYIIHTVEQGNTLYSISKSYAVDTYFIIEENKFLKEGLKVGQELKIPLERQSKWESKKAPEIQGQYLIHEVQKKETLYSISRKYGLEIQDIIDLNPDASNGLQVGQKLQIPATKSNKTESNYLKPAGATSSAPVGKKVHVVQPGETLYSLAKEYGVTMQQIIDANAGMVQGIKVGQNITIPNGATSSGKPTPPIPDEETEDDSQGYNSYENNLENPVNQGFSGFNNTGNQYFGTYKVAILLPFMAAENEITNDFSKSSIALDFYQGALLAIDSLKNKGLNVTVLVYDTKKDKNHVSRLLENPVMSDVNLFIGPMFRSALEPVVSFAERINAHVVCPVPQSNKVLFNHPNVSKIHVNDLTQSSLLGKFAATEYTNTNVVVIKKEDQNSKEARLERNFKGAYFKYLPGGGLFGTDTLNTLLTNGYEFPDMDGYLDETRNNIVFTPSSDPVLASGLLTHLKGYSGKYKIRVLGLESWRGMDKIDSGNKNALNLTLSSSHYVNYDSPATLRLIRAHRAKYKSDPSDFTYLGFDVAYFYLSGMQQAGTAFFQDFAVKSEASSTKFNLLRISNNSGFENKGAYIVAYDNYKLKVLN